MATTKGPVKGVRVPIKLPFKGATDNSDQFSRIKLPVALFLKFDQAGKNDLEYFVDVNKKNKGEDKSSAKVKVKRRRNPGFRTRSITVQFGDNKTGQKIKQTIGGKSVYSVSFPITSSVAINDVIEYFESGSGSGLKVMRVVDANSGQGYPIIQKA